MTEEQRQQRRSEKRRQITELQREKTRLEGEIASAQSRGAPTATLEAQLKAIEAREQEFRYNPVQDPNHPTWSIFRAKTAVMRQIIDANQPITLADAQTFIDMLYTDIDPKVNSNLQSSVLIRVWQLGSEDRLSDDARRYLRDSLLEYYHATRDQCDANNLGPMCSPMGPHFLGNAIGVVAEPGDAEVIQAFQHLKQLTVDRCLTLGWEKEASLYMEPMKEVEDRLTFSDKDVRGIALLTEGDLSQDDISKILRHYRRVLRAPARKVPPDVARTIDRNLQSLAQRDLNRKNWEDWADVVMMLGYGRASPEMRALIATSSKEKDGEKARAAGRISKVFAKNATALDKDLNK